MSKPKAKIKAKSGRNGPRLTKIKAKIKARPYIGDDAKRMQQEMKAMQARLDSLQRQLDSIQCEIQIKIEKEGK